MCRTFCWKFRHNRWCCILHVRRNISENNTNFLQKHDSLLFWDLDRKRFWSLTTFLCTVVKAALRVRGTISGLYVNIFYYFILFEIWARVCWTLEQKFGKVAKTAFYLYRGSLWRETIFSKKRNFHIILELWEKTNFTRDNLVSALFTRLRFWILEHIFEIFFQQIWIFSSIWMFENEFFPSSAQVFRRSCQNCILRVQTKFWWKIGFPLESVRVFTKRLDFTKKCWTSGGKVRHVHQSCILSVERIILKKNFLKELSFSFILWT